MQYTPNDFSIIPADFYPISFVLLRHLGPSLPSLSYVLNCCLIDQMGI